MEDSIDMVKLEKDIIIFLKTSKYVYPDILELAINCQNTINAFVDLKITIMREDKEFMNLLYIGVIKYDR